MPVRKTESRIPGGFSNASKLGFTDIDDSNKFVLVSYLGEEVNYDKVKFPFYNKYVVFVDVDSDDISEAQAAAATYEWEIETLVTDIAEGPSFKISTKEGVLSRELYIDYLSDAYSNQSIDKKLRVTVAIIGASDTPVFLSLTHKIIGLDEQFENFIEVQRVGQTAGNGSVYLTRYLKYFFGNYFLDAAKSFGTRENFQIEINLVVATAYQHLLKLGNFDFSETPKPYNFENEDLEQQLNTPEEQDFTSIQSHVGLCEIRPHILAMFLSADEGEWFLGKPGASSLKPFSVLDDLNTEQQFFESLSYGPSFNLDLQVDLYNLLRFPKTNIKLAAFLLNEIKNQNAAWKDVPAEELSSKQEEVISIVSQYYKGATNDYVSLIPNDKARKVFQSSWSMYVQEILRPKLISYEVFKIQVLDLRSGLPIQNAQVKRLEVFSSPEAPGVSEVFEHQFIYNKKKEFPDDTSLLKKAQLALYRLNYTVDTDRKVGNENRFADNSWGATTKNSFNSFWQAMVDGWEDYSSDEERPNDFYLREIVETYETHGFTDEEGILSIRVPKQYLEGVKKVEIRVSFFEFATALEKLGYQEAEAPAVANSFIQRPDFDATATNPYATGFRAVWAPAAEDGQSLEVDGDGQSVEIDRDRQSMELNGQSTEWNDYNSADANFGWCIKQEDRLGATMLKAVQTLMVKDGLPYDNSFYSSRYSAEEPYHFILFGMQWCQPVWQELPNIVTHRILDKSGHYEDNQWIQTRNFSEIIVQEDRTRPVICTRWKSGSDKSIGRGRDYGMLVFKRTSKDIWNPVGENGTHSLEGVLNVGSIDFTGPRRAPRVKSGDVNRPHHGIDYHAVENISPVFVPHGGVVSQKKSRQLPSSKSNKSEGYGNVVMIKIRRGDNSFFFRLAHLSNVTAIDVSRNDVVCAGKIIGAAGRTFNVNGKYEDKEVLGDDGEPEKNEDGSVKTKKEFVFKKDILTYYTGGPTHLHLEISRSIVRRRLANPKSIVSQLSPLHDSPGNSNLFLNNSSYRLFPCDCDGGSGPGSSCSIREEGTNDLVSSQCWASRNLYCPYIDTNSVRFIQAQLTYLAEDENNTGSAPYLHTNSDEKVRINGQWNSTTATSMKRFRWKNWAAIYPGINPPSEETDEAADHLDADPTVNPTSDVNTRTRTVLDRLTSVVRNADGTYVRTNLNRVDQ